MIEVSADNKTESARIMVIGVGGGGNNAVNSMVEDGVLGVTYACLNTDKQALERCQADYHLQIGQQLTKGLGAGAKPEIGEAAALENEDEIRSLVKDQDMVIVTCGMGGGTGTGGAPIIAKITHELGILTVGVVTRPFLFEGKTRMRNADGGIEKLKQCTDTLIVISNDKLLGIVDRKTTMPEALKKSDMILKQTIQGITDLISRPAMINLDFADVTTIMKDKGTAYIGIGTGHGENRTMEAVENALNSPLLETNIVGATHALLNISGDVTLWDVNEGAQRVRDLVSEDANIIFGSMYDDAEPDTVTVTIIATGVDRDEEEGSKEEETPSRRDYGRFEYGTESFPFRRKNERELERNESVQETNYNQPSQGQGNQDYMQETGGYTYPPQEGYMQSFPGEGSYMQQSGREIGQEYGYLNTGYYGQNVSETKPVNETKVSGTAGQMSGKSLETGRNLENRKITEFQSRKPAEPELKYSTIQSKATQIKDPEPERETREMYHNREENNSGFVIPDFIKRIRGKR